jgi:hypothetical protein
MNSTTVLINVKYCKKIKLPEIHPEDFTETLLSFLPETIIQKIMKPVK